MITLLTIDQVGQLWPVIDLAIEEALPPYVDMHESSKNNIRQAILSGAIQVWLVTQIAEDGRPELCATVLTLITTDPISGTKNMEFYSMYGYKEMGLKLWSEMKRVFKLFAKSQGCHRMVLFTNNEAVVKIVRDLGGAVQFQYLTMEVDDEE